jgi:prepilin-type processing-associated H-X9-DG protein
MRLVQPRSIIGMPEIPLRRCGKTSPGFTNNGTIVEPCEVVVEPYYYYGWAFGKNMFQSDADIEIMEEGVIEHMELVIEDEMVELVDENIELEAPLNAQEQIFRLREGIERFLITDINNPAASAQGQSELIVVMHDAIATEVAHFNHVPGGVNVLYLDGHVSFVRYTGNPEPPVEFPVNEAAFVLHELSEGLEGHAH